MSGKYDDIINLPHIVVHFGIQKLSERIDFPVLVAVKIGKEAKTKLPARIILHVFGVALSHNSEKHVILEGSEIMLFPIDLCIDKSLYFRHQLG